MSQKKAPEEREVRGGDWEEASVTEVELSPGTICMKCIKSKFCIKKIKL